MLKKASEVEFYKFFTVIVGYFLLFYGVYHIFHWVKGGNVLIYMFVYLSVIISTGLLLTFYKLRKKRKAS